MFCTNVRGGGAKRTWTYILTCADTVPAYTQNISMSRKLTYFRRASTEAKSETDSKPVHFSDDHNDDFFSLCIPLTPTPHPAQTRHSEM